MLAEISEKSFFLPPNAGNRTLGEIYLYFYYKNHKISFEFIFIELVCELSSVNLCSGICFWLETFFYETCFCFEDLKIDLFFFALNIGLWKSASDVLTNRFIDKFTHKNALILEIEKSTTCACSNISIFPPISTTTKF